MKNLNKFLILILILTNFLFLPKVQAVSTLNYSNIKTQNITDSSATISWDTDAFGSSFIAYGRWPFEASGFDSSISMQECNMWTMHHRCYLSFPGLVVGSNIYYRIQSVNADNPNNAFSDQYSFTTVAPLQITGLQLSNITDVSAKVSWTTDQEGYSDVGYNTQPFPADGLDSSIKQISNHASTTPTLIHEVVVGGLSPRTTYYLRVKSPNADGANNSYSDSLTFTTADTPTPLVQKPPAQQNEQPVVDNNNQPSKVSVSPDVVSLQQFINTERSLVKNPDNALAAQLAGRILLQTESKGETWYVNPTTKQKYYLKDGNIALEIMKLLGQGISTADLKKIPTGVLKQYGSLIDTDKDGLPDNLETALGLDPTKADTDGDGYSDFMEVSNGFNPLGPGKITVDLKLANSLKGKIVLQVQNKGEAWYINPVNGKKYYLGDGPTAYAVMRGLGLGITNANLRKIPVGYLSK